MTEDELRERLGACTCKQLRELATLTGTCLGYDGARKDNMIGAICTSVRYTKLLGHMDEVLEEAGV